MAISKAGQCSECSRNTILVNAKYSLCQDCNRKRLNPGPQKVYVFKKQPIKIKKATITKVYEKKKATPQKPIKQVSKKRAVENQEYSKIAREYKKSNPVCHVCLTNETTDVHHKKGKIGSLLCNTEFFLPACRECHNKIEENPKWAKQMGYSLNRLSN